jgi:hypothetical protein
MSWEQRDFPIFHVITYVIDQERRLVITTGSGHLTASEIQAHAARLKADSRFDSAFRELVTLAYQALAMLARLFRYGRLSLMVISST